MRINKTEITTLIKFLEDEMARLLILKRKKLPFIPNRKDKFLRQYPLETLTGNVTDDFIKKRESLIYSLKQSIKEKKDYKFEKENII